VGDTTMISFNVFDARGHNVSGRPLTFSLSDSTVMQKVSTYSEYAVIYRAIKSGTSVVTLTCEGVQGSVTVIVP